MGELTVSRAGPRSPEYGWLLPAALREEPDGAPAPRSTRDWVIDTLCFLLGLGWVLLTTADLLDDGHTMVGQWGFSPSWMVWLDLVVGTGLAIALWWRRRWPVVLAAVTLLTWFFSVTTAFSGLILLFTVAVHRRFAVMAAVAAASVVPTLVFTALRPERGSSYWETVTWGIVLMLIVLLWGMVLRSRRQLVVSLRERAERAESEQQLRVAQARTMERTRIAREMHDVLAHRISLLSLHAGALEIHPDAAPAEVAGAAGVIRASAHQALQDLREVIGVLREPAGDEAPERPQPTLRELPALTEESRAAGVKVRLELRVDEPSLVPAGTGRAAYRIVQEGLTNARKHAPGTTVRIRVAGAPGTGLTIDIRNPAALGARPVATIPGTGTGLIGLAERATLAGGRLTSGRGAGGEFTLTAWLPWPQPEAAP